MTTNRRIIWPRQPKLSHRQHGSQALRNCLPIIVCVILHCCLGIKQPGGLRAIAAEVPWIEVDPDSTTAFRVRETDQPFVAVGVNYFGPHVGWAPKLWHQFKRSEVQSHLQRIRDQGFNTIRVFLTLDSFHPLPGIVREEGVAKFRELIELCRQSGLRIIVAGPDHWEGTPEWLQGKDWFADEEILRSQELWWERFAGLFREEPIVLAWDLLNEPSILWQSEEMKGKWNAWLLKKYGSVDGVLAIHPRNPTADVESSDFPIPPGLPARNDPRLHDYQLFRESIAEEWTTRLVGAIRRSGAQQLITIGHVQWSSTAYLPSVRHYSGFDLRRNARHVDFVSIHFYPLAEPNPTQGEQGLERNAQYLAALLDECSVGKPVMIGEFAWYGGGEIRKGEQVIMPYQSLEDQVDWNRRLLEVSCGRVCGWLNWAIADTPTSEDLTRWSGLWTEDLSLKPWGIEFGAFAHQVTQNPQTARRYPDDVDLRAGDRRAALTAPSPHPTFGRLKATIRTPDR